VVQLHQAGLDLQGNQQDPKKYKYQLLKSHRKTYLLFITFNTYRVSFGSIISSGSLSTSRTSGARLPGLSLLTTLSSRALSLDEQTNEMLAVIISNKWINIHVSISDRLRGWQKFEMITIFPGSPPTPGGPDSPGSPCQYK